MTNASCIAENHGPVLGRAASAPRSQLAFLGVSAMLFVVSASATIRGSLSMAEMGDMPMSGGWAMSMMWMPMDGQTWSSAAVSFVGMWSVMMIAMMLPSLMPALWRYREAIGETVGQLRLELLTALVGAGYFLVWSASGVAVFAVGSALASLAMRYPAVEHAVPLAGGLVMLIAGVVQFTGWKARHLARCQEASREQASRANPSTAWRHGVRLGLHCLCCCANLTAILLVIGVMDLGAMLVVTAAITAERLASSGEHVTRLGPHQSK